MRKRILFSIRTFDHGGIPRCLQQLTSFIDADRYEIDLFCGYHKGPYREMLPHCNTLKESRWLYYIITNYRKESGIQRVIAIVVKVIRSMLLKINIDLLDIILTQCAKSVENKHYDAVIAYSEGIPMNFIAKLKVENRLLWIHNDYRWECARDHTLKPKELEQFKHIVCVSHHAAEVFAELYPRIADRVTTLYNPLDECKIIELSLSSAPLDPRFNTTKKSIISVGRLSHQKNFNAIPPIAAALKSNGISFCWYLLGNGPDDEVADLKRRIKQSSVEECVIILGPKDNPYPYLRRGDLFVLTSLYETYPTVINEAKILSIPIVSSNFNGVNEIMSEDFGIITEIDDMTSAIEKILTDDLLYDKYKRALSQFTMNNRALMNHFYTLIDSKC